MKKRIRLICVALIGVAGLARAEDAKPAEPPPKMPDMATAAKLMEKAPTTLSGTVTLDGKPLAGVRVTDGIDFVVTDQAGHYSIKLTPDPMIPYTPSRAINVCWPSNTWPTKDEKSGRWTWWARVMDVKDPEKVDFKLVSRQQKFPICIAWGTDPHDSFRRDFNNAYRTEVIEAGQHIDFNMTNGDLDYMVWERAEENFKFIDEFLAKIPVMTINVLGNHDLPAIGPQGDKALHELAGQGPFIKYLGPTRWSFDCNGVHFVAFNWPMVDKPGLAWLEKDLESVSKDTQTYLFIHMWDAFLGPIMKKFPTVKLVLAGHSHRNIFAGMEGEAQFWTKMSLYTYLYVNKDSFDFVDRCIYHGSRNGWDGHWSHDGRGCALYNDSPDTVKAQRGEHVELKDVTVDSKSMELKAVKGQTYDLRFGARGTGSKPATRWGMRLTGSDGKVQEFVYDNKEHMVTLMGLKTPFSPATYASYGGQTNDCDPKEREWVEMRIFVLPDQVRVLVNSRLHYRKAVIPGELKKIEFFAEDGAAEFGRVDVWQRTYKDYKPVVQFNSG